MLTLKRRWGGGIKTLHVWRLPILTGMKFGLSNLHVIFIFGVWNNRVKGILVVDFKNLKNFDFEKKKFFSGLRQKFLKIQFSLIFSKILIEFYFLRSNLNLECVQLSFDVHIVYLSQKSISNNFHWRCMIQKCLKFGHLWLHLYAPRMLFYKDFVKRYLVRDIDVHIFSKGGGSNLTP